MKNIHIPCLLPLVFLGWSPAPAARAMDDPIEFLHALQGGGYPDVAVDYLNALKDDPKAPKELLDVWDWEMSKSLRAASKWEYKEADAKRDLEQAAAHLKKFIDENPKRPEAVRAAAESAATLAEEAVRDFERARRMEDKEKRPAAMEAVRTKFLEVQQHFAQALKVNRAILSKTAAKDRRRADREDEVLDGRVKCAMVDFYVGLTYPKSSPERVTNMERAAKEFDDLYQANRQNPSLWSLTAHYFTGRCKQEENRLTEAKDYYEEVLVADTKDTTASTADNPKASRKAPTITPLDDLLAEVEQHYLECIVAEDVKGYLKEVGDWRTQHKALEKRNGYQAINFDLAKILLRLAGGEKTSPADKKRYTTAATHVLSDMVKIPSQYQQEAIKLRRQLLGGSDADEGLDEIIERGDEAAQAKKWAEAIDYYKKALEAAAKSKDAAKRVALLRNAVAGCNLNIGLEDFRKGKLEDAAKSLRLITDDPELQGTPTASGAAALLLNVLLSQYNALSVTAETEDATDEDKTAKVEARKQLEDTAAKIIARWPGRAEADAARLYKARLLVMDADAVAKAPAGKSEAEAAQQRVTKFLAKMEEATALFKDIHPKSEHYPTALYLTGYTYWRRYRIEKREIERIEGSDPPPAGEAKKLLDETKSMIEAFRQKAVRVMEVAVKTLKDSPPPEGRQQLVTQSQLLLAEMMMELNDPKKAATLFQALVDDLEKAEARGLDPTALQVCNGAVQAYLLLDDIDKAAKVSKLLLKLGPDAPNVNLSLATFGRRLEAEWKKAQLALEATKGPSEVEAAKKKIESYNQLLGDLLGNLGEREKLSPASMVWIARTSVALGNNDLAEKVARKFFERMENDEIFQQEGLKAVPIMRSLLISLMRQKGKFAEALEQVDRLVEQKPRALEPQMERCQILHAWAAKNPDKYPDAVHAWEGLRRKLEKVGIAKVKGQSAKKPRDLYDVTYNEALCLHNWAKKTGDKKTAKEGLQILKEMLLLDPTLNGSNPKQTDAENLTRFIALANKIELLLGLELSKKPSPAAPAKKTAAPAKKTETPAKKTDAK